MPLWINILLIDDKECISFPLFLTFSSRQLTTNFESYLISPENNLFALNVCLLSSRMFKWFYSNGRSYWNLVKGCFSLPCCCNDKDVTTYKDPPKFNSFRRYFNQIHWGKLLNKLIISLAKLSSFSIFSQHFNPVF